MRLSLLALLLTFSAHAQRPPHGQDTLPGPALSPKEAIARMKVPDGFTVELVAAEPDLVNPVAMTFDEKGRVWVAESLEYPRRSAGPGKDRVKVIEIGPDGKASKVTTFADGLNIPSGIAVGHGGVWVANAPDLLFYKVGKDGKAEGKPEVVVSGFGRDDTHELPNSLTWGPDGWLYGWNGVFNQSHIKHRGKDYRFTCAIFRVHPKTRDFEVWCEGTSNPWGLAVNENGDFFASACVIDHLWHLTESGYYHRQGGTYPPHTWKLGSIVKHKHQKAAYCGLHYFDSDAYPEKYRGKLFMGNIHGGCINVDSLSREGATYVGKGEPDFLTANDQWFMPVAQKTGPDGCLYILDWYDRYHCYQDANRDPKGIDRLNGRLYRIRYKDTPRAEPFDLAAEESEKLIGRLKSPNVYIRDAAQRLLTERLAGLPFDGRAVTALKALVLGDGPRPARLHALWSLVGGEKVEPKLHLTLLSHHDATFRAWGVRAAGNATKVDPAVRERLDEMVKSEKSPDVLVQLAIANRKLGLGGLPTYLRLLEQAPTDRLLPPIVWQNMHPLLETQGEAFAAAVKDASKLGEMLPRAVERLLASKEPPTAALAKLYDAARHPESGSADLARRVLDAFAGKVRTGELSAATVTGLKERLAPALKAEMEGRRALGTDAALLLAAFRDDDGIRAARKLLMDGSEAERGRALEVLASLKDESVVGHAPALLSPGLSPAFRAQAIAALGRLEDDRVAAVLLAEYAKLDQELRPRAIDVLTQRDSWGKALLKEVADKKIAPAAINVNQARRLLASKDKELVALTTKHWGTVRDARNPGREKVVAEMKELLSRTKGDPLKGVAVYKNLCGQCHKLHGDGADVGPDITGVGRQTFDLLLSNVFDPSLVIGPGYYGVTVYDKKGRALSGLLAEDGPTRVVLKVQGGKQEVIARKNVERVEVSKLSLMPEDVEKLLKPQEVADLFAFLCLDRPPDDPKARRIPGTPKGLFGEK